MVILYFWFLLFGVDVSLLLHLRGGDGKNTGVGRLAKRNVSLEIVWCLVCEEVEEIVEYLMVSCRFAQAIWTFLSCTNLTRFGVWFV